MKKARLLLLLSAVALSGCDFISISSTSKNSNEQPQNLNNENIGNTENNSGNTLENDNNSGNTNNTNTDTDSGTNTDTNSGTDTNTDDDDPYVPNIKPISEVIPNNTSYSLSDYTDFSFHEGHEPMYRDDWTFVYGTSINPNGRLWKNPNEKSNASGIQFIKNTYVVSPLFDSWKKVEVRFNFWFSSHTSSSFKATEGKPQFVLEGYDESGEKLTSEEISIAKSDIPNNNTSKWITCYIRNTSMRFFVLRWNNYIPNGNSGYTSVLCDAKLKGWDYN